MCFVEFIGYTCGHTSLPVLRPCPLTTASHTFPACPRRADKPFLAGEMCAACQKIVHSRATQIEEYEHRFMHERGVCGCDTVFPYLIRPRVIGGGWGGQGEDEGEGEGEAVEAAGGVAGGGDDDDGAAAATERRRLPPLLREATDTGGQAVVAVRLPSLYAAEWVADHRERHAAGLCRCDLDFRTHQQAAAQEAADPGAPVLRNDDDHNDDDHNDDDHNDDDHDHDDQAGPPRPPRRTASLSSLASAATTATASADYDSCAAPLARSSSHQAFTYFKNEAEKGEPSLAGPGTSRTAATAAIATHRVVRYAGAVFAEVPAYLPLMGPFLAQPSPFAADLDQPTVLDGVLALVDQEEGRPPPPDLNEQHIQHARQRRPLAGLPLGAGPEGVSHARPWRSRPPCWGFGLTAASDCNE